MGYILQCLRADGTPSMEHCSVCDTGSDTCTRRKADYVRKKRKMSPKALQEWEIDFCIGKCGCGYCNYKAGREPRGWPCIEYICADCRMNREPTEQMCKFCKEGERE